MLGKLIPRFSVFRFTPYQQLADENKSRKGNKMQTFQINSHINENGIFSVKLPKEWAEKDVNVILVVKFLNQLKESNPQKESLAAAFDLLAQMPEDLITHRQDNLPEAGRGLQPRPERLKTSTQTKHE